MELDKADAPRKFQPDESPLKRLTGAAFTTAFLLTASSGLLSSTVSAAVTCPVPAWGTIGDSAGTGRQSDSLAPACAPRSGDTLTNHAFQTPAPLPPFDSAPSAEHGQTASAALRLLDRAGSGGLRFKDDLGARVLQRFIEAWDPEHDLLLAADIREFERYQSDIIDAMRGGDLDFAFEVFRRIRIRLGQRTALALGLLNAGLDFERDDYLVTDANRRGRAEDWATLREHWRRRLKNEAIELILAGFSPSEARETLRARYQALYTRVEKVDADTVVERLLDTYAGVIDRHGAFLSPRALDRLRTEAGGVLDGIGVMLRREGQHAVIRRLVPGGPADRSQALGVGDRILGIGAPGSMRLVDVVGWPIHDVAERLRGPKDTAVRLRILPAGEQPRHERSPSCATARASRAALQGLECCAPEGRTCAGSGSESSRRRRSTRAQASGASAARQAPATTYAGLSDRCVRRGWTGSYSIFAGTGVAR